MDLFTGFALETLAGLVGVFAGVILALWTERGRQGRHEASERERRERELAQTRSFVLSSVVRNTSEAKRLQGILESDEDPYLFETSFELAVWEAAQAQFVQLAPMDERVLLTRFFNQIRRLIRLIEFHRHVRVQLEMRQSAPDSGDQELLKDAVKRLKIVADEVRIDGIVIISDLGETLHKRLLGMHEQPESQLAV